MDEGFPSSEVPGRIIFNKLVRDDFDKKKSNEWSDPVIHTATDGEYKDKLRDKLSEELGKIRKAETRPKLLEEFADFLEVIYASSDYYGFTMDEIQKISYTISRPHKGIIDKTVRQATVLGELDDTVGKLKEADLEKPRLKWEYAGMLGLLKEAIDLYGFTYNQVDGVREDKKTKYGGFSQRKILDSARKLV